MSDKIKSNPTGRGEAKPNNRETFKVPTPPRPPKPPKNQSK